MPHHFGNSHSTKEFGTNLSVDRSEPDLSAKGSEGHCSQEHVRVSLSADKSMEDNVFDLRVDDPSGSTTPERMFSIVEMRTLFDELQKAHGTSIVEQLVSRLGGQIDMVSKSLADFKDVVVNSPYLTPRRNHGRDENGANEDNIVQRFTTPPHAL